MWAQYHALQDEGHEKLCKGIEDKEDPIYRHGLDKVKAIEDEVGFDDTVRIYPERAEGA